MGPGCSRCEVRSGSGRSGTRDREPGIDRPVRVWQRGTEVGGTGQAGAAGVKNDSEINEKLLRRRQKKSFKEEVKRARTTRNAPGRAAEQGICRGRGKQLPQAPHRRRSRPLRRFRSDRRSTPGGSQVRGRKHRVLIIVVRDGDGNHTEGGYEIHLPKQRIDRSA